MRYLTAIIISFAIVSCTQVRKKQEPESSISMAKEIVSENLGPIYKEEISDTNSFEYFLNLTDEIIEEIPTHLIVKYIDQEWNNEDDPDIVYYSDEMDHYKLYDFYILTYEISVHGVMGFTKLAIYSEDGKMLDEMTVSSSSDMDLSSTSSSGMTFNIYGDSIVQVLDYYISAKDYSFSMPDSITLYDLDSTQIDETENYSYYIITMSGEFQRFLALRPALEESQLRKLDKVQLRLLRNEFFARKGYIFKSKDLQDHFGQMDWYKPRYNDVTYNLTPMDNYNISLIKQFEAK